MSENDLKDLLTSLNQGDNHVILFGRPLIAGIEVANHWIKINNPKAYKETYFGPDTMYLIKIESEGKYIGLVEDRGLYDLHWFILPEYRGKGLLSNALRTVILPHLFQDNRNFQCITVDSSLLTKENYNASRKLAESVGFIYTHEENSKALTL